MAEFTAGRRAVRAPAGQPVRPADLERVLRTELARRPEAGLRTGVEVLGVEPVDGGAVVRLQDLTTGHVEHLRTPAVLGCDGAASLVRDVVGARWQDLRSTERWLVVDVRCPVPLGHWEGVHQVCSPVRAATFLRVGVDRYRWEFQLHDANGRPTSFVRRSSPTCPPWNGVAAGGPAGGAAQQRVRLPRPPRRPWRRGRVLLVATRRHRHAPSSARPGAGARRREPAWKLAAVLRGDAPESAARQLRARAPAARPHR
jgi:3-(3-hydroxy-phenyl)propionate hydroxylase